MNSPSETIFLKSIDTYNVIKDAKQMFELLDFVVEELGKDNVMQIMIDGATGKMLEKETKVILVSFCISLP